MLPFGELGRTPAGAVVIGVVTTEVGLDDLGVVGNVLGHTLSDLLAVVEDHDPV